MAPTVASSDESKSVVKTEVQMQRSIVSVTAAKTKLKLSDANYRGRLGRLGDRANAEG
ncbi:hypothetical protein [Chamaesiphon sp. OTE_75_metabat_556]|uniref:hypothetical protein n=1 Tax=Chamaesiphon sp. OTE_75_metabat_556 TaxID=2964692 RepID=UPI00286A94FD|nr:hypothetical protein [Chamaesiphon sp. OTE_75_metabat_556]